MPWEEFPPTLTAAFCAGADNAVYEGLYAAGECACVSVHGANRLGTNSLVDLVVFGRRAGKHMADFVKHNDMPAMRADAADGARAHLSRLYTGGSGKESAAALRDRMRSIMMDKVGIYRTGTLMNEAVAELDGAARKLFGGPRFGRKLEVQYRAARGPGA